MSIEVRAAREEDREVLDLLGQRAFMATVSDYDESAERWRVPLERRLVAADADRPVGKLAVWEMGQWFGGRRVPMGGVGGVAVDPTYRGRGVGRRLLDAALPAFRERGEALATLYPMNHGFYRKYGWELAGSFPQQETSIRGLLDLPPPERSVTVRAATEQDLPALREAYDRVARDQPGNLCPGELFASVRMLSDGKNQDAYLAEIDGVVTGSVTFGHEERVDSTEMYALGIRHFAAVDSDTELALWRVIAGHYPVAKTLRFVSPPHLVASMLLGERDTRPFGAGWCWMTRLVDAAAAIEARGYSDAVDAEVSLDIVDPQAPWNAGPHVLRVKDGSGRLEPGGDGRVRIGIGHLAALYSGWADPRHLARLGLLSGAGDTELAAFERAFCGRPPWSAHFF